MPSTKAADNVVAVPAPNSFTDRKKSAAQNTMQNSTPTANTRSTHRPQNPT